MINVFKRNEGFVASTFAGYQFDNDLSKFPEEIKNDILQIENSVYQDLLDHKLMWNNGKLVNNPNYSAYKKEQDLLKQLEIYYQELTEIKQWFLDNDWKVNKIIIGEWEQDNPKWVEYLAERPKKRARQDELNNIIKELKGE